KSIQLVEYPEIAERLTGCAEAQGVAQLVARRGICGGVSTARGIRDGLFEEPSCQRRRHGVSVLIVSDAGRAVGQSMGGGLAGGSAAVGVGPLERRPRGG